MNSMDYAIGRRMVRKFRRSPEIIQLFMHHPEMTYSTATESWSASPSSISEAKETTGSGGWSSDVSKYTPIYAWSGFSAGAQENNILSMSTSILNPTSASASTPDILGDLLPLPTVVLPSGIGILPTLASTSQTTNYVLHGTPAPAQAPVHTRLPQSSCTPSPTKSLAPSASKLY